MGRRLLAGLQRLQVADGGGAGDAFEFAFAEVLDLDEVFDFGGQTAAYQDLAVGGVTAQARCKIPP